MTVRTRRTFVANALVLPALVHPLAAARTEPLHGYIGTYTRTPTEGASGSKGIYEFYFDANRGAIRTMRLVYETDNPSYLAQSRDRSFIFALNEIGFSREETAGRVHVLQTQRNRITPRNDIAAECRLPCCLALSPTETALYCTSYEDGVLSGMRLGPDAHVTAIIPPALPGGQRSRLHHVSIAPDAKTLIIADFGADRILLYRLDEHDLPAKLPAQILGLGEGRGPRSMDRLPQSSHIYVLNQKSCTIMHLSWNESDRTVELRSERSCVPRGLSLTNYPACVRVSADGRFVYASNRGHDSIAVFPVLRDGDLGEPAFFSSGGVYPRHFTFDPTGRWLLCANEYANNITIHSVDPVRGSLQLHAESTVIPAPAFILLK